MKKLLAGLVILGAAAGVGTSAHAQELKFDDTGGSGGTFTYDGNGGPAVGTNIIFDNILGTGTPSNSGVAASLDCVGCLLNFTTGDNLTEGTAGGAPWTWAAGGSIKIEGTARTQGGVVIASGTLLEGTFAGQPSATSPLAGQGNFIGGGLDVKNEDLLAYFGLPLTGFEFVNSTVAIGCDTGTAPAISCNVSNADLNNTAVPVPAPGTLALLGLGLLGIGARRLRK